MFLYHIDCDRQSRHSWKVILTIGDPAGGMSGEEGADSHEWLEVIRQLQAVPGCSWLFQAVPGCSRLFLAVPGCSRMFQAEPVYGHVKEVGLDQSYRIFSYSIPKPLRG